ncbi:MULTISPECIES: hypothetical protein [Halobacterium]|uniref:DUF7856 family protein n=1 Tax=Halobacterium TaxID=2239 RepID=UPI00073F302F|nr:MULTISPECIES: hypothetical protein [Halobacterium]MCG1004281.1 hypothetical protein [Halobacterium noricense]
MRVDLAGGERCGRALDLRDVNVTAASVAAAVRDADDDRVACASPRPVHERVGFLHRGMSVAPVAALAAAARTRGATTEYDAELRAAEDDLAAIDAPNVDLSAVRERVAETASDVDRLRERVARASGRVEAQRESDADAGDAEAALREATRELAALETDHHAAKEELAAARERAREARDARERRLSLADRRDNLRRAARRELADVYGDRFRAALDALPVSSEPAPPREFSGPDWVAGAAAARLARPGAPLVVACEFENASRAAAALDAPVALVEV